MNTATVATPINAGAYVTYLGPDVTQYGINYDVINVDRDGLYHLALPGHTTATLRYVHRSDLAPASR